MAINCYEPLTNNNTMPSTTMSTHSKSSNLSSCRYMKIDYTVGSSVTSNKSTSEESKKSKTSSPYLVEDRVQLMSRVTEKRLLHKKTTDFVSSFPLAVNIYKANSDDFKASKKGSKKMKKSVLTLPNKSSPLPQTTVSDINDSEYFNDSVSKDVRKPKPRKRRSSPSNKKGRIRGKGIEVYDRDAMYCSQLNIDLDSSSTEIMNQFTGDGNKSHKKRQLKSNGNTDAHNVWSLLRDMNRFQFRPSPPGSLDSMMSVKNCKNHTNQRLKSLKDAKLIETCRTEEFTYISSVVDSSPHNSQSSIDRVTVIDKKDELAEICEKLKIMKNKMLPLKDKPNKQDQNKFTAYTKNKSNRRDKQNTAKIKCNEKDNKEIIPYNEVTQKLCNNPCSDFLIETEKPNEETETINNDACNITIARDEQNQNEINKMPFSESQKQLNGITKVVLNKGQDIVSAKKKGCFKRKPYIETTIPKKTVMPKLTKTEIRRRLANIKYPLIILDKDQLSSTVCVKQCDPPQFTGLDDHIWPFMQNWLENNTKENFSNSLKQKGRNISEEHPTGSYNAIDYKIMPISVTNNNINNKKGKSFNFLNENDVIPTVPQVGSVKLLLSKEKPISHFKDRMLQFLCKKSPADGNANKSKNFSKNKKVTSIDVSTSTPNKFIYPKTLVQLMKNEEEMLAVSSSMKHPWARKRWTSDFIENVIKRIRSGVYYNQEERDCNKNNRPTTKENTVQTEMEFKSNDYCLNCNEQRNSIKENDKSSAIFESIPGFNDTLSDLEIETNSKNQISIKHCVTNVVVQFDVTLPFDINRILHPKKSYTCIPVSVMENQTKVFKSKTAIVNAILPAELCSIFPNMLRKLLDSKSSVLKTNEQIESHLSTISELPAFDKSDPIKYLITHRVNALSKFQKGNFAKNLPAIVRKRKSHTINYSDNIYSTLSAIGVLPFANTCLSLNSRIYHHTKLSDFITQQSREAIAPEIPRISRNKIYFSALQTYSLSDKQVLPAYTRYTLYNIAEKIMTNRNFYLNINMPLLVMFSAIIYNNKTVNINVPLSGEQRASQNYISKVDSPFNMPVQHFGNDMENDNIEKLKSFRLNNVKQYAPDNKAGKRSLEVEYCSKKIKNKRRHLGRLYGKCKSMSSIFNERSSTALNKINNLEDFFLALGMPKMLANVFDPTTERKILSSIKEMRNWMTDITPKQTLLILLLANKKDTSNLVRYRAIILQGIAVNRITRASELDMEIEVIEKENLQTFPRYEGISYLPASEENQDSLLEELCWIAKTTASDYQKPFDESSERLLKSLLQKRKKLNPSYLRVMARYVGLGLLKTSK